MGIFILHNLFRWGIFTGVLWVNGLLFSFQCFLTGYRYSDAERMRVDECFMGFLLEEGQMVKSADVQVGLRDVPHVPTKRVLVGTVFVYAL